MSDALADNAPDDATPAAQAPTHRSHPVVRVVVRALLGLLVLVPAVLLGFLLLASNGLDEMKALHGELRPGMKYSDVLSVADGVPRASWSCFGGAKPITPPCETLLVYTSGDQGSQWGSRLQFDQHGILLAVGAIEYLD